MSWLSLSLPNPFESKQEHQQNLSENEEEPRISSQSHGGGVKEDLSEFGKSIGRQLWGVASFLAPPPVTATDSSSQTLLGIRNDFAEIGGSLKSGFSRFASNLLQFQNEDEVEDYRDGIVGVTEEVLEFVREISIRPECWINFPLSLENNDFDMSDVQREHTSMVERFVPTLRDLKVKLCPSHMNEGQFWMKYFILLHSRLNEHDLERLATPQIVEARYELSQRLQNKTNTQLQSSKSDDLSMEASSKGGEVQEENTPVPEKKDLVENVNAAHHEEVDADQWLAEDGETGTSFDARKQFGKDQDFSFSDLEEDDNDTTSKQGGSSLKQNIRVSSPNVDGGWVRLSENSDAVSGRSKAVQSNSREKGSDGEESNEWLTVDDFDSDSTEIA